MVELSLIAIVGLLLLVPLEIVVLIILYALKYRSRIRTHLHKKGERYGWEDYFKLPPETKQHKSRSRRSFFQVFLIVLGVIIVTGLLTGAVVTVVLLSSGTLSSSEIPFGITSDLSKNVANETVRRSIDAIDGPAEPDFEVEEQDETVEEQQNERVTAPSQKEEGPDYSGFTGIDLPSVNLTGVTMPALNFSAFPGGLNNIRTYVIAAVIAVVLIILAIVSAIYAFSRRKLSVIKKARKTAEKLSKKAEKKFVEEKDPWEYETAPGFKNWINIVAALVALLLFAVILYVFLGRFEWTAGSLKNSLFGLFGFLYAYAFYVIVGIVLLIVALAVIIFVEKKFNLSKL